MKKKAKVNKPVKREQRADPRELPEVIKALSPGALVQFIEDTDSFHAAMVVQVGTKFVHILPITASKVVLASVEKWRIRKLLPSHSAARKKWYTHFKNQAKQWGAEERARKGLDYIREFYKKKAEKKAGVA